MARNKLTAVQVKKGEGKLFDGAGLYLAKRNVENGRWLFRYKFNSKSREMGLGPYPLVSLADARADRDKWESVLRGGEDPIAVRDRLKAEQDAQANSFDPTFEEAAQITFEAKKDGLRRGGASGKWMSPIRLYMVPALGSMRMSAIHQSDIRSALAPIWRKKHPTAEKALQRTKIIFTHMRLSGADCDPFLVDMAKHMLGDVRHEPVKTPATPWKSIPQVFAKLQRDDPSHLCLRFMLLTAVRSHGCRGARFDEIDGDVWTVPEDRMKGREGQVEDFRVPLSSAALEIVRRAQEWRRSDFMFPGQRIGGISEVAINKVFKKIDPEGTPHGLRTSFRTWVQDTEAASYDVAETALAHIIGKKVERSYARSDLLDPRRILMEKWAQYVTGENGKVVPLRGTR